MDSEKLAVILPGIGYHRDKPLLYYAAQLVRMHGFSHIFIEYHDMPQKIRGNAEMMRQAAVLAVSQTEEQLRAVDFSAYEQILLIGKSIGTVAAARFAADRSLHAAQIWYTPLTETFSAGISQNVIAFIGDADPWSDVACMKETAAEQGIPLLSYPDCNHSLECGDAFRNLENLSDVMRHTAQFLGNL